jgi:SAM-dependent methyltransferase
MDKPVTPVDLWACPACLGDLAHSADTYSCRGCSLTYPLSASGQPDFRPRGRLHLAMEYAYDPDWGRFPWDLVRVEWPQNALPFDVPASWEATEVSLVRSIPAATGPARALDLGCGNDRQRFLEPLTRLGYALTGVDIDGAAPHALADAHLLPLRAASFDLLVTSAVFEHVKQPHVVMAEAARVAKPGALFVGSIAFGEPYHISYFHHSPLAVFELLDSAGFECRSIVLTNRWNAFLAHLEMGFAGARYPGWLRRAVAGGLFGATLVHATVKRLLGRGRAALDQDRASFARCHSAAVGFVAARRAGPAGTRLVNRGAWQATS